MYASPVINIIHDMVMWQVLIDVANENDGPLRIIKNVFDPGTPVVKFDVGDSVILKLMFSKKTKNKFIKNTSAFK